MREDVDSRSLKTVAILVREGVKDKFARLADNMRFAIALFLLSWSTWTLCDTYLIWATPISEVLAFLAGLLILSHPQKVQTTTEYVDTALDIPL
tara:strand:+ start:480 stop:761 length:282 start_codon:yes stop_codon:yes gene_type:complete